jgi:ribulose-phosphate 3-epimerase
MSRTRVAPSLLACDLARVGEEVASVAAAGADLLHFDVMDGAFVPNLTFGPGLCSAVRQITQLPLDVHLMVADADSLLDAFVRAGANRISVHVEAVRHLHRTLSVIRERGVQPGVALNPATPLAFLEQLWPHLDFVLLMTVNPGFGGQHLIPETIGKLAHLRAARDASGRAVEIVVDGGVDRGNAAALRASGADTLVAGTAVFRAADRRAAIAALRGEENA